MLLVPILTRSLSQKMELAFFIVALFLSEDVSSFSESPEVLDELPLKSLLKKRSVLLDQISHNHSDGHISESTNKPVAEALVINPLQHMRVRKGPVDRGHFEEVEEEEEEWDWMPPMMSKGKLSGIFDVSITALSFLAFGGYLICLIFNVVREKENSQLKTKSTQLYQQLMSQANQKPTFGMRPAGRRRRYISTADDDFDPWLFSKQIGKSYLLAENPLFNSSQFLLN